VSSALHDGRLDAVLEALRARGVRSVADLGCGDGALLLRLVAEPAIQRVVGVDLSGPSLEALRARLAALPEIERSKAVLVHGSALAPHAQATGCDAAVLVEVIEHVDPVRLSALEHAVFGRLRPATVVLTTPNADFNALLGVPAHRFRHPDHRFEWGRVRFAGWAEGVAVRHRYAVRLSDLGGAHPTLGGPSQMACFTL
jgi:3' terminal RNA ribose 2'-O-methyltransferase Hen1